MANSLTEYAQQLRQAANENLQQAHEQAMAFDSQLAKTLDNIAQTGRSAGAAYEQIADGTQTATQATQQHAAALSEAEQKAKALEKSFKDAQAAASELGVDMGAATAAVGKATASALENVQKLSDSFDVLQQKSVDAALLIRQALAGSLKNAANEQDIAAIKAQYSELGKAGKLAMRDVEDGILAADLRLQELRGEIDPTAAAFKKLGVQSKEAMALSAREMQQAFARVEDAYRQGKVSAGEMHKAVEKTAQAMANSGDAQQMAWAKATAAAYGYTVAVDETGKATVEAAKKATAALDAQAQEKVSHTASQAGSETAQTAEKTSKSIQATTRQVSEMGKVVQNYWQQVNNPNGAYSIATSMQNTAKIMSGAWANYVQSMWRGYDQTRRAITDLNAATQSGVGIAANLAAAESLAASNAEKLDKQTLDNLRAAIDDARQKMQALSDEAASTRAEIEKELLQAQGKDTAEMEQQQKLAKLRAARQAAADAGNSQAVNDYNASLAAMEQIYRLKKQKQQEQEAEKAVQRQPEKVEIKLPDAPKIDVGNIDLSGISSQLGERDKAIVEQVKTALVAELQKQLAAQR